MNRKFLIAIIVVVAVSVGGYNFYRVRSMQQQLKSIAVRNNILVKEVLEVEKSAPNMTFAEYLNRLQSNRSERDELKRKAEEVEPYRNRETLAQYVRLFDSENEYVRAEEARVRQMVGYSTDKRNLEAAKQKGEEAVQRIGRGQASFLSESWIERNKARDSESTLDFIEETAIKWDLEEASHKELEKSATELTNIVADCVRTIDNLSRDEQLYYPEFLPSRNLGKQVKEKKSVYTNIQNSIKADRVSFRLE